MFLPEVPITLLEFLNALDSDTLSAGRYSFARDYDCWFVRFYSTLRTDIERRLFRSYCDLNAQVHLFDPLTDDPHCTVELYKGTRDTIPLISIDPNGTYFAPSNDILQIMYTIMYSDNLPLTLSKIDPLIYVSTVETDVYRYPNVPLTILDLSDSSDIP